MILYRFSCLFCCCVLVFVVVVVVSLSICCLVSTNHLSPLVHPDVSSIGHLVCIIEFLDS